MGELDVTKEQRGQRRRARLGRKLTLSELAAHLVLALIPLLLFQRTDWFFFSRSPPVAMVTVYTLTHILYCLFNVRSLDHHCRSSLTRNATAF